MQALDGIYTSAVPHSGSNGPEQVKKKKTTQALEHSTTFVFNVFELSDMQIMQYMLRMSHFPSVWKISFHYFMLYLLLL